MDMDERSREILSVVAHDLRNPLQIIQGYVGMLLELDLDADGRRQCLERILKVSRWTEGVVGDLVDAEAVSQGKLTLRRGTVELDDLLSEVVGSFCFEARERGVTLELAPIPGPFRIEADCDRLRQVFHNLLSNALRHASGGRGRVRIGLAVGDDGVVIGIHDDGAGIAAAELEAIFGRWSQGDRHSEVGHLGLGLFIAQRIIDAHHGRLWAESEGPGRGATFWVCLPVRPGEAHPPPVAALVPAWQ